MPLYWRRPLNLPFHLSLQAALHFPFPFPSLWFIFPEGYSTLQRFSQTVVMKTSLMKLGQISVTFRISITDAIKYMAADDLQTSIGFPDINILFLFPSAQGMLVHV